MNSESKEKKLHAKQNNKTVAVLSVTRDKVIERTLNGKGSWQEMLSIDSLVYFTNCVHQHLETMEYHETDKN